MKSRTCIAALLAGALGFASPARADDDQPTRPDDVRAQLEQAQKMVRELQERLAALEKQRNDIDARRTAVEAEARKARDVAEAARLAAERHRQASEAVRRAMEKEAAASEKDGKDPLVVRFSEEVDPKSITPDGVRVRRMLAGPGGRAVMIRDARDLHDLAGRLVDALGESVPGAEIEAQDGVIVVEAEGNAQDVQRRVEEAIKKGVDVLIRRLKVVHEGDEATDHVTIDLVPSTRVLTGTLPVPPPAPQPPRPPMAPPVPPQPMGVPAPRLVPLPPARYELGRLAGGERADDDVRDAVKGLRDELRGLREEMKSLREELRGAGTGPR